MINKLYIQKIIDSARNYNLKSYCNKMNFLKNAYNNQNINYMKNKSNLTDSNSLPQKNNSLWNNSINNLYKVQLQC